MTKKGKTSLPVIGWFEYIDLPGLGIKSIKVNVDSDARSSSSSTLRPLNKNTPGPRSDDRRPTS